MSAYLYGDDLDLDLVAAVTLKACRALKIQANQPRSKPMNIATFTRQDPPPAAGAQGRYTGLVEACKAEPGVWFKLDGRYSTGMSTAFKVGRVAGVEPGEFEATCRNTRSGKADVYARYVGPVQP